MGKCLLDIPCTVHSISGKLGRLLSCISISALESGFDRLCDRICLFVRCGACNDNSLFKAVSLGTHLNVRSFHLNTGILKCISRISRSVGHSIHILCRSSRIFRNLTTESICCFHCVPQLILRLPDIFFCLIAEPVKRNPGIPDCGSRPVSGIFQPVQCRNDLPAFSVCIVESVHHRSGTSCHAASHLDAAVFSSLESSFDSLDAAIDTFQLIDGILQPKVYANC